MNRKQRREQRAKERRADRKRRREEYRASQTDTFWVSRSVIVTAAEWETWDHLKRMP